MTPEERAHAVAESSLCRQSSHDGGALFCRECGHDADRDIAAAIRAAVDEEREACWRIAADAYSEPDGGGHTPDWYGAAGHVMDAIFRRGKA